MKCNEIRNLALAYLDSELDAKTSQEIQLHLQTCAECALIFEKEEKFNNRLFGVLRAGRHTPVMWDRIESLLQPGGRSRRPEEADGGVRFTRPPPHVGGYRVFQRWKMIALGGLAALLVAGLVAASMGRFHIGAPALDLAQAVEEDHREFLAGKFGPEFTGALPASVAHRLDERLDAGAFSQLPAMPEFEARGSRLCFLRGVPAAWTLGQYANAVVSFVVLKQSQLDHFPQIRQRLESGDPVVCVRMRGYQFAARLVGDHVVCAVGRVPKQILEDLVKSVPGPG